MTVGKKPQLLRDCWEQQVRADPAVTRNLTLVLLTLASYGNRQGTGIQVGQHRLHLDTGLGERTVWRHLHTAVELGYLVQLSRGHRRGDGQGVASVYQLALPPGSERLTGSSTRQSVHLNPPISASQPATGGGLPEVKPPGKTTTTSGLPDDLDVARTLAMVVVEGLPDELQTQLTASTVTAACRRLADDGWTPEQLAEAVVARQWHGARGGGAVIAWLRELQPPKVTPARVTCGTCDGGFLGEDDAGRPIPCPTCKPHLAAGPEPEPEPGPEPWCRSCAGNATVGHLTECRTEAAS